MQVLDKLVTELGFDVDKRGLSNFDKRLKGIQNKLNGISNKLFVFGGAGAAALGLIGKAGLDTDEALNRTQADLAKTTEEMHKLREEALKIGSALPLDTADIVLAQRAYGKLGAEQDEIIKDIPAIAGAAVATGLAPEQVAAYARTIQNIFGGDIAENLDLMIRIANRSPATFQAMGESIQFAGQSSVDMGLDFKTYLSTLGGMAAAGRGVESASQGMIGLFARLAKAETEIGRGGKIVTTAFEQVGIEMADVEAVLDGTSQGWLNFIELLHQAGLSKTELTALFSTLAGDTYSSSISFLIQNPDEMRKLLKEAELAPGEVARVQEIILQGASGGLIEMRALIDTILNRLSEFGILSGIESFTRKVSALLVWLTATDEEGELLHSRILSIVSVVLRLTAGMLVLAVVLRGVSFALGSYSALVTIAKVVTNFWRGSLIALRIQLAILAVWTKISTVATKLWRGSIIALRIQLAALAVWTKVSASATAFWTVATIRANAISRLWRPSMVALRIQLAALAIWTKVSAGATALWTFATNAGRVATLRSIATSVIARGVMIAAAIATGVVTAAQWLLNIAMTANPIGIVISGRRWADCRIGAALQEFRDFPADCLEDVGSSQDFLAVPIGTDWICYQGIPTSVRKIRDFPQSACRHRKSSG